MSYKRNILEKKKINFYCCCFFRSQICMFSALGLLAFVTGFIWTRCRLPFAKLRSLRSQIQRVHTHFQVNNWFFLKPISWNSSLTIFNPHNVKRNVYWRNWCHQMLERSQIRIMSYFNYEECTSFSVLCITMLKG